MQELVEGKDSGALRELAAVAKPADWWEAEPLLKQSFEELKYEWPDEDSCYWECATETAREILSGTTSPDEGCARIYQMCVALKYPNKLRPWDHLSADLDPDSLSELSADDFPAAVMAHAKRLLHGDN